MNTWGNYVRRVIGDLTQKEVGDKTGLDPTAISRWLSDRNQPQADKVVRFARAFGQSPVEALIAAAYITSDEAGITTVRTPIADWWPQSGQ